MPWEEEDNCRAWNSGDNSALFSMIQCDYGLNSRQDFFDAMKNVAMRHKFHPIKDLLNSFQWDGREHIRSLLPEYLGAEDSDYTYQVMRLWMLGAVARIFRSGCKFDYCMILQGAQGVGKSTLPRLMTLDDSWFSDSLDSLDTDRSAQSLIEVWICELAELKSLARTTGGMESVKKFLTATQDRFRQPYERRADTYLRSCVFMGTTNKSDLLSDQTGNRRFLIVKVGEQKPEKNLFDESAMEDIRQSWAEAVYIWKNEKPTLILPESLKQEAEQDQNDNMADDGSSGIIEAYLEDQTKVCAIQVWQEALGQSGTPPKAWYADRDPNTNEPKTTAQMFFTVYYAEKGDKMLHHFQGKIDIGSGNGGIISQLKMQNEMKLTDESWISYQQGKGNEEYQKYMEDLTDMQNHVLPYLQSFCSLEEKGVKEKREQQVAEKNESREAVPRAGVEINTAVKDAGKAERKAITEKKAMPGKEKKPSIHERLEINKRIIQEKISWREELIWV